MFGDFIKKYERRYLPSSYEPFLLMDFLGMDDPKIASLDYFEYSRALDYCILRHQMTNQLGDPDQMQTPNTPKGKGGPPMTFPQKPGWDHDPNFVSEVPPR